MPGIHITDSVRTELLGLGLMTMFMSPAKDTKMSELVGNIVSNPNNNKPFLNEIGLIMKAQGFNQSALLSLDILAAWIEAQGSYTASEPWITAFIIAAVTGIFVALRVYAKWFVSRNMKSADYLIILAWLATIGYCILTYIHETQFKVCHHVWDFTQNEYKQALLYIFWLEIIFVVVTLLIKMSIMMFYWDLVPRLDSTFRFFHGSILASGLLVAIASITGIFTVVFQCKPVDYWNNPLAAKCLPRVPLWTSMSSVVAFTDFLVLILPIKVVWNLNLRRREKIIVTCLFGLGTLSCVAAIPRIIITAGFVNDPDLTFKSCEITVWALLEFCLAIIAACIPSTKALVILYTPRLLGSRSRSRGMSGGDRSTPREFRLGRNPASDSQRNIIEEVELKDEVRVHKTVEIQVRGMDEENSIDSSRRGNAVHIERTRKVDRVLGFNSEEIKGHHFQGHR